MSLLAQINEPEFIAGIYTGKKLTSFNPWVLNWLLSSCLAKATVLLLIMCLRELTSLSGISSLSRADAKRIIWMEDSWRFLNQFLLVPSFSIMCSSCFVRILFCSSCLSAWRKIVVFRRLRTAELERSAAGGGGKPPGTAAQGNPPEGIMQARCLSILKHSRSESVGLKMMPIALTWSAPIPQGQRMKSPA